VFTGKFIKISLTKPTQNPRFIPNTDHPGIFPCAVREKFNDECRFLKKISRISFPQFSPLVADEVHKITQVLHFQARFLAPIEEE